MDADVGNQSLTRAEKTDPSSWKNTVCSEHHSACQFVSLSVCQFVSLYTDVSLLAGMSPAQCLYLSMWNYPLIPMHTTPSLAGEYDHTWLSFYSLHSHFRTPRNVRSHCVNKVIKVGPSLGKRFSDPFPIAGSSLILRPDYSHIFRPDSCGMSSMAHWLGWLHEFPSNTFSIFSNRYSQTLWQCDIVTPWHNNIVLRGFLRAWSGNWELRGAGRRREYNKTHLRRT